MSQYSSAVPERPLRIKTTRTLILSAPLIVVSVVAFILFKVLWMSAATPPQLSDPRRTHVRQSIPLDSIKELFRRDAPNKTIKTFTPEALRIHSHLPAAFQLTDIDALSYTVTVRFRLFAHNTPRPSEFGIILGYRQIPSATNDTYRYQVIYLRRLNGIRPTLCRRFHEGRVYSRYKQRFADDPGAVATVPDDSPGVHTLKLTVGAKGLEAAQWDTTELSTITTSDANMQAKEGDYTGIVALLTRTDPVDILSCEFVITQYR